MRIAFLRRATMLLLLPVALIAAERRVLLVAGTQSHGAGFHEYRAGVLLWQKWLAAVPGLVVEVSAEGWPADPAAVERADAIILYCDGGPRHLALQEDRLAVLDRAMARGAGLGLVHYAVEPTPARGQTEFLRWVGGAFEPHWSVNPHWDAAFASLPTHPITRGVQPFTLRDEWYFQMRFAPEAKARTPLLVAVPRGPQVTSRPDGDHSGNPAMRAAVARGDPQVVSWAWQRADGGRGWAFTGGHFHKNWGDPNARKLLLNAIVWLAHGEVPAAGVESTVTPEELAANWFVQPAKK